MIYVYSRLYAENTDIEYTYDNSVGHVLFKAELKTLTPIQLYFVSTCIVLGFHNTIINPFDYNIFVTARVCC